MADITNLKDIEKLDVVKTPAEEVEEVAEVVEEPVVKKASRVRGKRYVDARSMVDRTVSYPASQAIELLKSTSYSRFDGTVTAHLNLRKADIKPTDVKFPHSTGVTLRVAIADEQILADLAEGKIEFDVLLSTPDMMPKLAKFARLLGPKGLMPNPKTGTVTSDPEAKKKELAGGTITVRPEKKAPLMHVRIGKVSQDSEQLLENLNTLLAALPTNSVTKITLAATMSPGIKVKVE